MRRKLSGIWNQRFCGFALESLCKVFTFIYTHQKKTIYNDHIIFCIVDFLQCTKQLFAMCLGVNFNKARNVIQKLRK